MKGFKGISSILKTIYTSRWVARSETAVQWSIAIKESIDCSFAWFAPVCNTTDRVLTTSRATCAIGAAACGTASKIPSPWQLQFTMGNLACTAGYAVCDAKPEDVFLLANKTSGGIL
jgi:hypothetical protein